MFHYKVKISYKGTNYYGWQAQSSDTTDEPHPTIQGSIQNALMKIAKEGPCVVSGSSRTDAGVHAKSQLAKFRIPKYIEAAHLQMALNYILDGDIRIIECEECKPEFRPNRQFSEKEYHYYFTSAPIANPLFADIVAHIPGPLDMVKLEQAAKLFEGEHDFHNFYSQRSTAATSVRNIYEVKLIKAELAPMGENIYYFQFKGNGFLKQMIRFIVAAIFDAGRNEVSLEQIQDYLTERKNQKLSSSAPAKGLHLIRKYI